MNEGTRSTIPGTGEQKWWIGIYTCMTVSNFTCSQVIHLRDEPKRLGFVLSSRDELDRVCSMYTQQIITCGMVSFFFFFHRLSKIVTTVLGRNRQFSMGWFQCFVSELWIIDISVKYGFLVIFVVHFLFNLRKDHRIIG